MKKNNKKRGLFLFGLALTCFSAISYLKSKTCNKTSNAAYASSEAIEEIDDLRDLGYLELFNEDGSMEMSEQPVSIESVSSRNQIKRAASTGGFRETKLTDSGKPDSDSIVVTIMGDGFTASQQSTFLNSAKTMVDYIIGNDSKGIAGCYPFNLFKEYFTIYAIEVISEQSGVSRDSSKNNGVVVNNYFGSSFYYGDDASDCERALVVTKKDRVKQLKKSNTSMTLIICNSTRWGGTGGEYSVISNHADAYQIMLHEFGHSLGHLADEYYYPKDGNFTCTEKPNRTHESDPSKVKWKDFIGVNAGGVPVGVYSYSSDLTSAELGHSKFDPNANNWYKPTKNKVCKMQDSSKDFCPVCSKAMLDALSDICEYYPVVNGPSHHVSGVNIDVTMTAKDENENIWSLKVKNNTGERMNFQYNSMTCFESDAREWNNICHIVNTGYIEAGASTDDGAIKIQKNGLAETIVISYIKGQTRYIFYAYDLENNGDMTCKSSTKDESVQVKIINKEGNKWNLILTNNTGERRTFYYNKKLCFEGDAKKWSGLTDIYYVDLYKGASTMIEVSENGMAGTVAVSYVSGNTRYIYYAYGLDEDKRITSYRSSIYATNYVRNNMELQLIGKRGDTWLVNLTNLTGASRQFEYNRYLCFEGDAKNWNLNKDVRTTSSIANGKTTISPLQITENGFAGTMAISYTDGTNRYIAYAYNISTTGSMSAYKNTIPLSSSSDSSQCVTKGTPITLADGSKKKVETLTGNELLLTWNLETGKYEASPILFIDSDPKSNYEVITLTFSDNTKVEVVSEHGFFDSTLNKYVYLDKNAEKYIGHTFIKESDRIKKKVKLKKVKITNKVTKTYSPVTYGNLCYYVNGMLSMPGGIDGLFNYFKVDPKTMMYDKKEMLRDIKKYGLFTYQEFYSIMPIPEEIFNAVNGKYLKVAIGKGLITYEKLEQLVERYSVFF